MAVTEIRISQSAMKMDHYAHLTGPKEAKHEIQNISILRPAGKNIKHELK